MANVLLVKNLIHNAMYTKVHRHIQIALNRPNRELEASQFVDAWTRRGQVRLLAAATLSN